MCNLRTFRDHTLFLTLLRLRIQLVRTPIETSRLNLISLYNNRFGTGILAPVLLFPNRGSLLSARPCVRLDVVKLSQGKTQKSPSGGLTRAISKQGIGRELAGSEFRDMAA
jgi:hypothetical protein